MNHTTEKYNWISVVPESWKLVKLKYLSSISTGVYDTQDKLKNGTFPFFVRSPHIERIDKYSHDCEAVMTAGDGVGVGKVFHYYNGKFAAHQRVYLFNKFKSNVLGKYIYYSLMSNLKFEVLQGNAKSTVDSLRYPMLANFPIILPTLSTQIKVVEFLDQKTSEIDALISDKEKLIKLLEEKRQAIITEAVTKGLDPDVKMKDSGVEWIGEIPEHWVKNKFKRATNYIKDGTHGSFARVDDGYPLLSAKNVIDGEILIGNAESHVSSKDFFEINKSGYLKNGCVLLTIVGTLGRAAIYSGEEVAFQRSVAIIGINPKNYNKYIYYVTQGDYFKRELELRIKKSAQSGVYLSDLALIPTLLPPLSEQIEISKHLDYKVQNINNLIKDIKTQIKLIKEYRQALIYEAVTGKIDVQEMERETEQEEVSSP